MINALTVDVEDYFHVSAFEHIIDRSDWDHMEPRVEQNTRCLLKLLESRSVKATFFVLGWVAERSPELIREIRDLGHEVASHGYDHRRVSTMTKEEFRQDLRLSKEIIEQTIGEKIIGYRAPSFSVVQESLWALDILREEGFAFDSSIFPIRHDRYGFPESPRFPWLVQCKGGGHIYEFPISTLRVRNLNLPFIGGGYLRHFPYRFSRWGLRHLNDKEEQPGVVYVHPWEIDPDQPRQESAGWIVSHRHYWNLEKTVGRLAGLLEDFQFAPIGSVLGLDSVPGSRESGTVSATS